MYAKLKRRTRGLTDHDSTGIQTFGCNSKIEGWGFGISPHPINKIMEELDLFLLVALTILTACGPWQRDQRDHWSFYFSLSRSGPVCLTYKAFQLATRFTR